jgi:hypothetical protein
VNEEHRLVGLQYWLHNYPHIFLVQSRRWNNYYLVPLLWCPCLFVDFLDVECISDVNSETCLADSLFTSDD